MSDKHAPVVIDLDDEPLPDVGAAPPVDVPQGEAGQAAVGMMAGRGWGLGSLVLGSAGSLLVMALGAWAWAWVQGLMAQVPVLGYAVAGLVGVLALSLTLIALREAMGFWRVRRLDSLRQQADQALSAGDLRAARGVAAQVAALYGAPEPRLDEALDAQTAIETVESTQLLALDAQAARIIEGAARQVAMATALVPLAFADVLVALTANLRMIRQLAELYGGRPGALGNWRLARAVAVHLMATGAVAVGDDLIGSLAGGGVMSKLSRRFGEGVVNGALTARVGVAAMDLCRPLPWRMGARPSVTALTANALRGLFQR